MFFKYKKDHDDYLWIQALALLEQHPVDLLLPINEELLNLLLRRFFLLNAHQQSMVKLLLLAIPLSYSQKRFWQEELWTVDDECFSRHLQACRDIESLYLKKNHHLIGMMVEHQERQSKDARDC